MRMVVVALVAGVLLGGCGGGEPDPSPTSATAGGPSTTASSAVAGDRLCEAFDTAVSLPHDDVLDYVVDLPTPTGWASNKCRIQPAGEYFDAAAKAGVFGRVDAEFGVVTDGQFEQVRRPEYDSANAEDLLTRDQAEPVGDELPCAIEPCDAVHGYRYTYQFESAVAEEKFVIIATFDYITTDVGGDQQDHFRKEAVTEFNAAMAAMLAEIS